MVSPLSSPLFDVNCKKKKRAKEIPLSHIISFDWYSVSLHVILMILLGVCHILNNENNRPPTKAVGEVSGDGEALPSDHETTRKSQGTTAAREWRANR